MKTLYFVAAAIAILDTAAAATASTNVAYASFQTNGVVRRVNVSPGDRVERGSFLAALDTSVSDALIAALRQTLQEVEERMRQTPGAAAEDRSRLWQEIREAQRRRRALILYSPAAGEVETVNAVVGSPISSDQPAVVIRSGATPETENGERTGQHERHRTHQSGPTGQAGR